MELARLRSALGAGQLELEIDKLRALLGAVEADVRLLRQVKNEEVGADFGAFSAVFRSEMGGNGGKRHVSWCFSIAFAWCSVVLRMFEGIRADL